MQAPWLRLDRQAGSSCRQQVPGVRLRAPAAAPRAAGTGSRHRRMSPPPRCPGRPQVCCRGTACSGLAWRPPRPPCAPPPPVLLCRVQALVLSPTRELASQTTNNVLAIGDHMNVQVRRGAAAAAAAAVAPASKSKRTAAERMQHRGDRGEAAPWRPRYAFASCRRLASSALAAPRAGCILPPAAPRRPTLQLFCLPLPSAGALLHRRQVDRRRHAPAGGRRAHRQRHPRPRVRHDQAALPAHAADKDAGAG